MIPLTCPHCERTNDHHQGADPLDEPEPGDVSICWACRRPSIVTEIGTLRKPTDEEMDEIIKADSFLSVMGAMFGASTPTEAVRALRSPS